MDGLVVLAALLSAALHAAWNAAARARPDAGDAFASFVIAAGIWAALALPFVGLPATASLPWLAAGVVANVIGMRCLVAAYERTSFAIAYPVARGLYPPIVLVLGLVVLGDAPGLLGITGILCVSAGLLLLTSAARSAGGRDMRGLGFAALAALMTAAYVACDVIGIRVSGNVLGYAACISFANAIVFGGMMMWEGRRPIRALVTRPVSAFGWSAGSILSYLLVLWGFTLAPAALVSSIRETSVLFATFFAALFLKETLRPVHWAASALAFLGVVLIRLG